MDKFTNITFISLGYNCYVKMYINTIANQQTYLFDWIGSPMWGINKFINNSFNLFNKEDYKTLQIYTENEDNAHMHCNTLYYFKFIHDIPTNCNIDKTLIHRNKNGGIKKVNYYDDFKNKYTRRIERFNTLLSSNKCIVFIRFEECMKNKVIHEDYKKLYSIPELEYINEFIHLIKNKYPKLKFRVIYVSKSQQTELNNDLLILHNDNTTIDEILDKNIKLINNFVIFK